MLGVYPKCRRWTTVRFVLLAQRGQLPAKALSQNSQDSQNSQITKNVVRAGYPKCRSRAVARLVMLAAWAKWSLLNDYPKCRSWAEARECGSEKLKARKARKVKNREKL